jgi:hypothetical protein
LRNGFVDQMHELNMFSVLDKVRDNKDDWRKQIERMKRGRHHLTEEAKVDLGGGGLWRCDPTPVTAPLF